MAKVKGTGGTTKKSRPPISPEARESLMISLAMDAAEQQLRDGTASAQVITHFLKLGTETARIEREIMEKQKDLISAKTESLRSEQRMEELVEKAINAMRNYSGNGDPDEY